MSIKQSPYQSRKDLANVVLNTAAGAVSIPYIDLSQAKQLRDFVLYQVETTEQDWM